MIFAGAVGLHLVLLGGVKLSGKSENAGRSSPKACW